MFTAFHLALTCNNICHLRLCLAKLSLPKNFARLQRCRGQSRVALKNSIPRRRPVVKVPQPPLHDVDPLPLQADLALVTPARSLVLAATAGYHATSSRRNVLNVNPALSANRAISCGEKVPATSAVQHARNVRKTVTASVDAIGTVTGTDANGIETGSGTATKIGRGTATGMATVIVTVVSGTVIVTDETRRTVNATVGRSEFQLSPRGLMRPRTIAGSRPDPIQLVAIVVATMLLANGGEAAMKR